MSDFFTDGEQVGIHYRTLEVRKDGIDDENRTVELSFSSETEEVERAAGIEILDHSKGSARLARINTAAPLLVDHDPADQIGVVDRASIGDDKRGHAVVRFSKSARAQEIFQDVKDGIRSLVSVGYRVFGVSEPKRNQAGDTAYRVTDWEPYEISLVSIPADMSVGVGRAGQDTTNAVRVLSSETTAPTKTNKVKENMSTEIKSDAEVRTEAVIETPGNAETRSNSAPAVIVSDAANAADIRKAERTRQNEIRSIGSKFGFSSAAEKALDEGTSADEFRKSITEAWEAPSAELDHAGLNKAIGMTEKDQRNWSYLRALRGAKNGNVEGFEREVSDEAARHLGVDVAPNSFVIPADMGMRNERDLEAGTDSEGGYGVQTSVGNLIEKLDAALLARRLGAPLLTGLQGNLTLPRVASHGTSSWVDEEGSVSASAPALGQVALSPKRLATRTIYSDQLMAQNSFSTDQWVRNDQAITEALAVDLAYFDGTGSSNQPTGITATSGVNAGVTFGGAMEWADWVNMWTELSTAEADGGRLSWVTSAASIAKGLTTAKVSSTDSVHIINETVNQQFSVLGLPVEKLGQALTVTNQLLLGDFSKAGIASWGARKVVVDPYSLAATGQNVITCNSFYDIFVTQPTAFSKSTDSAAQ